MSQRPKTVLTRTSLTASSSARLIVPEFLGTGFSEFIFDSSIAANHLKHFLEHGHVFARGDHEDSAPRIRGCYVGIRPTRGVGVCFQFQTQTLEAGTNGLPHFGRVFADARGEYQGIDTA